MVPAVPNAINDNKSKIEKNFSLYLFNCFVLIMLPIISNMLSVICFLHTNDLACSLSILSVGERNTYEWGSKGGLYHIFRKFDFFFSLS